MKKSDAILFHLAVQKWCIPALFTYIPSLSQHVLACISMCAFILHSSTACVHFNYFRALFACIFIGISVYRTQYSGLSEKCLNVVGMHAHSAGTRQGSVRIPTVFQHCLRAFLLLSNTLCVHFYCFLLHFHFYSIMFLVWIGPKNAIERVQTLPRRSHKKRISVGKV